MAMSCRTTVGAIWIDSQHDGLLKLKPNALLFEKWGSNAKKKPLLLS